MVPIGSILLRKVLFGSSQSLLQVQLRGGCLGLKRMRLMVPALLSGEAPPTPTWAAALSHTGVD